MFRIGGQGDNIVTLIIACDEKIEIKKRLESQQIYCVRNLRITNVQQQRFDIIH